MRNKALEKIVQTLKKNQGKIAHNVMGELTTQSKKLKRNANANLLGSTVAGIGAAACIAGYHLSPEMVSASSYILPSVVLSGISAAAVVNAVRLKNQKKQIDELLDNQNGMPSMTLCEYFDKFQNHPQFDHDNNFAKELEQYSELDGSQKWLEEKEEAVLTR